MKFRTEIDLGSVEPLINPETKLFLSGSCFANNIAEKLKTFHFKSLGNPFGVLFNAASIAAQFELLAKRKLFSEEDLIFHSGTYHSFYHNTEFSGICVEHVLEKINKANNHAADFIKKTEVFILTFGTSYVYEHLPSGMIVSNCHKIPSSQFRRKMLSTEENHKFIKKTIETIKSISPAAQIILTVSPIRHLKDGLHQNQLSKASLLLAIEKSVSEREDVHYFPSYEILLDDLRDYRFYAEDLTHPSRQAVDYIWEKFTNKYFSESAHNFLKDMERLNAAVSHRPINTDSPEFHKFNESQLQKINELEKKYPFVKLNKELSLFESRLNKD